jgi:hypothetical protein
MGTWGSGNFDSDSACDIQGDKSSALIKSIWSNMQDPASREADEDLYDKLFVELEWLLALEAAKVFSGWGLPAPKEVDEVTQAWLAGWSDYFDGLSGPEFKAERRAVIEDTFARFREACVRYEALRQS